MESATRVQNLDEAVCISLHTNILGKCMNPSVLPQLGVNCKADCILYSYFSNTSTAIKTLNSSQLYTTQNWLCQIQVMMVGLGIYIYIYIYIHTHTYSLLSADIYVHKYTFGGARGVMVIVAGYGSGDTISNPGPDWLHFT